MGLDLRLQGTGDEPDWLVDGFSEPVVAGQFGSLAMTIPHGTKASLRSPDACIRWTVQRHVAGPGAEVVTYDTGPASQVLVTGPATVTSWVCLAIAAVHYVPGRGTVDNTVAAVQPRISVVIGRGVGWAALPEPVVVADTAAPVGARDAATLPAGPATIEIGVPPGRARIVRVLPAGLVVVVNVQSYLSGAVIASATVPITGAIVPIPVFGRLFAGANGAVAVNAVFAWETPA